MSLIYLLFNSKVVSPQNVQLGTKMNYPFYVSRKLLYWGPLIFDVTNFPWLFDPSPCHHFFTKDKPTLQFSLAHYVNVKSQSKFQINAFWLVKEFKRHQFSNFNPGSPSGPLKDSNVIYGLPLVWFVPLLVKIECQGFFDIVFQANIEPFFDTYMCDM